MAFFEIREAHIFSLWTATSLFALHFSCLLPVLHNFIVLAHKYVLVVGLTYNFMGKSTLKGFDFLKILGRSVLFRFLVTLNEFAVHGEDQANRTNY